MHRTLALALALALALVMPAPVLAAPSGAATVASAEGALSHWVGPDAGTIDANVSASETALLWAEFAPTDANRTWNATFNAFFTSPGGTTTFALEGSENITLVIANGTAGRVSFGLPNATAPGTVSYNLTVALSDGVTNTTLFALGTYEVASTAEVPVVPAPGLPMPVWIGLGVGLLGVLTAGILLGRQRAQRRAMNEGPKRSQVMREMELEQKLEKAKDPEQVQEIKAEIRQQEQVREKRRELQILEAKRADVLKTLDLLKKRHESGGLTKLQYDNMVAKKQGDLQKIEADIAQMEAEDAGGAAAS